jgi:hypothetical protein
LLTAKLHSALQHGYLMLNTAPMAQQDGARLKFALWYGPRRPVRCRSISNPFEQAGASRR